MGSDDILFLVVFIIIPTAILVSGFWLFLFLRRGRPAQTVAADATDSNEEAVSDPDELDENDEQLEFDEQPTVIIDDFEEDEDVEEEIGPMTADLLAESEEPLESEAETIETPILDSSGLTDEIPAMPDDALEPARVADLPDEEWQPMPAVESDEIEESQQPTAVDRPGTTVEEAESEAAEDDDQRSAGGKLLPGRHSQGRKRRSSRRAPKLRRLRRDEDSVEGSDGSGGVDSGDRK